MTPRNRAVAVVVLSCTSLLITAQVASRAQQSSQELEQLVAPIAVYPDGLVAEILAAATYPADVDDAAHWLQLNATLSADQVARTVDAMDWDPSVKALTEFPIVLVNMGQNLAWTSALGDAYYNQPDDVMDAIQALRARALRAGTLQSNSQITVLDRNGVIAIEPSDTGVVYVPSYDCWTIYGPPIRPWPGFFFFQGLTGGPRVVWSLRFQIGGPWVRVNWGWQNWGFDWHRHRIAFQRRDYVSQSPSVIDRHDPRRGSEPGRGGRSDIHAGNPPPSVRAPQPPPSARGGAGRGAPPPRGGTAGPRPGAGPAVPRPGAGTAVPRPGTGSRGRGRGGEDASQPAIPLPRPVARPKPPIDPKHDRGFPASDAKTPETGTRAGALNGFNHGGVVTSNSDRGKASMGVHPAPPPPPPAESSPAPKAGRGRGRGGV